MGQCHLFKDSLPLATARASPCSHAESRTSARPIHSQRTNLPVRWQALLLLGAQSKLSFLPQHAPCCIGYSVPTHQVQLICEQISSCENKLNVCKTVQREPPAAGQEGFVEYKMIHDFWRSHPV